MVTRNLIAALTLLLIALTGCAPPAADTGLQTQAAAVRTDIAQVRASATRAQARVTTTLAYLGTRAGQVRLDSQNLQATLIARGTDPAVLREALGDLAYVPVTETPFLSAPGVAGADAPPDTVPGPRATAASLAGLRNIVTAQAVGQDDCAVNPTTTFANTAPLIYVVATADGIAPGTTISSTWSREGSPRASFQFRPDFFINNACIWFFMDQSDTEFTAGGWQVDLTLNGAPAGSARFTIQPG
jgi:hypothetical protein